MASKETVTEWRVDRGLSDKPATSAVTVSPNARASSTTDGETRAKNIGVSVYMRIK